MASLGIVDWHGWITAVAERAEEENASRRRAWSGAKRRWDVAAESSANAAPMGDARLAAIRHYLDSFEGFARSDAQKRFHVSFVQSLLPHIYGSADFERNRERILRENGMTSVQYDTLVCAPRRFGKTVAISMLCAVLLAICNDMYGGHGGHPHTPGDTPRYVNVLRCAGGSRCSVPVNVRAALCSSKRQSFSSSSRTPASAEEGRTTARRKTPRSCGQRDRPRPMCERCFRTRARWLG